LTLLQVAEKMDGMKASVFRSLSPRQQNALVVALLVRNALEDFHAANLSNAQMKELNRLIRYTLYEAITQIEVMAGTPEGEEFLAWVVTRIPDYWEIPGRDLDPTGRTQA
jgi:hypothetical protein